MVPAVTLLQHHHTDNACLGGPKPTFVMFNLSFECIRLNHLTMEETAEAQQISRLDVLRAGLRPRNGAYKIPMSWTSFNLP
mmetsp:Transcript_26433/g.32997  ORF Transcript_26433/g.32997 Transcript_26433/m.32997 type:complete len:81 (-) Transcript_26433:367-609(-)